MTADSGYIQCSFSGPEAVMAQFCALVEQTDRQNGFSCGLSWLDELDCDGQVQCDAVSYDTIDATREFLEKALTCLPELSVEGTMEHSWSTLSGARTVVTFEGADCTLRWEERTEEEPEDPFLFLPDPKEADEEDFDPSYPTTPYG